MKRVIKCATAKVNPEYESYFDGDPVHILDKAEIQRGMVTLNKILADYDDGKIDHLVDYLNDQIYDNEDWDLDTATIASVVADACDKDIDAISRIRMANDADFFAVDFDDGTVKYFFDRGVLSQGIKDADTGRVYLF